MPAAREELRFFVDESMLGVAKALAIVRRDVVHPGHPLLPDIPTGTLDPDWMPRVAALGLVAIGRDRRWKTRPGELAAIKEHGLRMFRLAGRRELTSWGKLGRLVRRWDDLETVIAARGPGPWFFAIREHDVDEIPLG